MRDTAVVTTTMPPVQLSRWIGRGLRGRIIAPSDRSSRAHTATLPPLPVGRTTTGQGSRCGTKGGQGQHHVDDRHPPAGELRRTPADCRRADAPGARRLGTRWGYLPAGERLGARIAGIVAPETHAGQAKCRGEIALGRSATARARTLLEGQTITIIRVGTSYNRTVARVRLAGRDAGSELVATGVARWWPRWRRKPNWCALPALSRADRWISVGESPAW